MPAEKKSTVNQELKKINTGLLDKTKYWGIILKIHVPEIKGIATIKGYLVKIDFIPDLDNIPFCCFELTQAKEGELKDILNLPDDEYTYSFQLPLKFDILKKDIDEVSKFLIEESEKYLKDIKFVCFDTNEEIMKWALQEKFK